MSETTTDFSSSLINPMIQKFCSKDIELEGIKASSQGIGVRAIFFHVLCILGFSLCVMLEEWLPQESSTALMVTGIIMTVLFIVLALTLPFLSFLSGLLAAIFGSIFAISCGYAPMWFCRLLLSAGFFSVIRLAYFFLLLLLLTLSIIMAAKFPKQIKKAKMFFVSAPIALVLCAVIVLILWLIPGTRTFTAPVTTIPALGIVLYIVYLLIADILLIPDFLAARQKAEYGIAAKYDWAAAAGLCYNAFYFVFKFDNLFQYMQTNKNFLKKKQKD